MVERPAPSCLMHATTVAVEGRGVLLYGPSGSGKSDVALRLIERGAQLVADDQCAITRERHGILVVRPPPILAGKIEARGVGILDLPYRSEVFLALAVCLGDPAAVTCDGFAPPAPPAVERLPEPKTLEILGVSCPTLTLSAWESSTPFKIALAVRHIGGITES